jgi:MFS family permease
MLAFGMWLFSHVSLTTSQWTLSLWMIIIGAGLGSFMQVTILAVQNAVDRSQMGTATSSVTFFRTIGSSLGGAVFGTVLLSRLNHHLADALPAGQSHAVSAKAITTNGPAEIMHLPAFVQHDILLAFVRSFHDMFLIGVPFALAAFVAALFLRERPLRGSADLPSEKSEDVRSHSPVEL